MDSMTAPLTQVQSNILQKEIQRPVVDETTTLGAAYAAGLAVDYWRTLDEIRANWKLDEKFTPNIDQEW